jgi:hypothetical protein
VGFTFLALASYLCNKLALRAVPQLSKQGAYSSLLLVLHARNDPKSAACRQMGGNLEHPAGSDLRVGTASPKGDAARMIDRASLQMAQFRSIDLVRRFAS